MLARNKEFVKSKLYIINEIFGYYFSDDKLWKYAINVGCATELCTWCWDKLLQFWMKVIMDDKQIKSDVTLSLI